MKNKYSKFVKYLEKQNAVYAQRKGDSVYLSDGKIILEVPEREYHENIRPLSGMLIDMDCDCTASNGLQKENRIELRDSVDLFKVIQSLKDDVKLFESRFFVEVNQPKKPFLAKLFFNNGNIVAVNKDYIDIFNDIEPCSNWCSKGKWSDPIIKKVDDTRMVAFPIRIDPSVYSCWKADD